MPEPFKHVFSLELIQQMGDCLASNAEYFDNKGFVEMASQGLEKLELKARSQQIVDALHQYLPSKFLLAIDIMLASLAPMDNPNKVSEAPQNAKFLRSWAIMPMAEYVGIYGVKHFDVSLDALLEMTKRFTSEFAIRHLIIKKPTKTLSSLQKHLKHPSEHVRRLISEGTRPRLPWGMQLKRFIEDPSPLLPLLSALKDDPSEYVRRSVANNLNDIAKDHPDFVINVCSQWYKGADANRIKLIRHACRTLFKKGVPEALALFGFVPAQLSEQKLKLNQTSVTVGQSLNIEAKLVSNVVHTQQIMLDYVVYHKKANGSLRPKVFKWKVFDLPPNIATFAAKSHSFKVITTRDYYAGEHCIALLINGREYEKTAFTLSAKTV